MRIATFSPIFNKALRSKDLPTRIKVMDFGQSLTLDEPVFVNSKTLTVFYTTQKSIGRTRVPIDFNHNTVEGSKAYENDKEPRAIAGYGTPKVNKDGLFLEDIQWTPSGEKAARDYEDLSPAPILDENGVVVGLHSVALTPAGAIQDLHFYSADSIFKGKPMKLSAETKLDKLEEHLEEDVGEQEKGIKKDKKSLKDIEELEDEKDEEVETECYDESDNRHEVQLKSAEVPEKGGATISKNKAMNLSVNDIANTKDIDHKPEKHEEGCTCGVCSQKKTISTHKPGYHYVVASAENMGDRKLKTMSALEPKAYVTEPSQIKTFKTYMHEQLKQMAAEMNLPDEAELEKRLRNLLAKWLGEDGETVPEGPITNKQNSTPAQFTAEVKDLNARLAVLENDRNEAIARYEAQEKQAIVSEASRNGKIVPFSADELKEISPKILKSIVDKLPKEVPTKLTTKVLNADGKSAKPTMSDAASAWQDAVNAATA